MNNIITKINTSYHLNVQAMVDADFLAGVAAVPVVKSAISALFMLFNDGIANIKEKVFDVNSNLGFEVRKNLLFNTTGNVMNPARDVGKFKLRIPLDHLFNFCKFYRNGIYNARHELRFTRQSDDMAIFRSAGVANPGKIRLN